ncbi:phosphotransferase enzyme family protein [Streptomyces buecherae]|uniref:phosphotransferase enzyme family protein n=1 Tax=Streptomyces buecherae TaxID=2763006 RepID=UPI0027E1F9DD|nr:aminoglycoside phosphotransferase family protein [Streptomyces buecherae]
MAPVGQFAAAQREVEVATWLLESGIPTVRPLDVRQPVTLEDGRPVTFWEALPEHEHGTVTEVAALLRDLHALSPPPPFLRPLDPFVRIADRLDKATTIREADRGWLRGLHTELSTAWRALPPGAPHSALHGDAWRGNLVRTGIGPLMMDLERFSVGPPEWDLVSTAIGHTTTGSVSPREYETFCAAYGADVTQWTGYPVLAGIRELRMATYAALHAARHPQWVDQAQYRIDCLRGRHGPRPWHWKGIL